LIGLQLVSAAVLQEQHAKTLFRELSEWACAGNEDAERNQSDRSTDGTRVLLRRVPCGHVPGLMPEHTGELRFVVEEWKDAARDVNVAARKREGVDRRHIHNRVVPRQIWPFGKLRQFQADAADVFLEIGIVVESHLLLHLRVGFLTCGNLLRLAHQVELTLARGRIGRARIRDNGNECSDKRADH